MFFRIGNAGFAPSLGMASIRNDTSLEGLPLAGIRKNTSACIKNDTRVGIINHTSLYNSNYTIVR